MIRSDKSNLSLGQLAYAVRQSYTDNPYSNDNSSILEGCIFASGIDALLERIEKELRLSNHTNSENTDYEPNRFRQWVNGIYTCDKCNRPIEADFRGKPEGHTGYCVGFNSCLVDYS